MAKFYCFWLDLALGRHNFGGDTLKVMLTNAAPALTAAVPADITEIAAGNGYSAGGVAITVSALTQTLGAVTLVLTDKTITASGAIGPYRYAVLYNATSGRLIAFADYGSSGTSNNGDPIIFDFVEAGALTIAP